MWHPPINLKKFTVTQAYGVPNDVYNVLKHHPGRDYGTQGEDGWGAYIVHDGVVTDVGAWDRSIGNYLFYYCADIDRTFAQFHHRDPVKLKVGDTVTAGQKFGTTGKTGFSMGIHCHIECLSGKHTFASRASITTDWTTFSAHSEDPDALIRARLANPVIPTQVDVAASDIDTFLAKIDTIHLLKEVLSRPDRKEAFTYLKA